MPTISARRGERIVMDEAYPCPNAEDEETIRESYQRYLRGLTTMMYGEPLISPSIKKTRGEKVEITKEKIKTIGYKVWISKEMSEDGETVLAKIKINNKLKNLLRKFTTPELKKTKEFSPTQEITRYLVKKVITNSIGDQLITWMLFNKELVDNGIANVHLTAYWSKELLNLQMAFKSAIQIMCETIRKEKIIMTFNEQRRVR